SCTGPRNVLHVTFFLLETLIALPHNELGKLPTTVYRYSRADLLRILRLTARQLASWEKAGLVAAAESYSFFDLLQIKKVRDLCARKVRPAVIRQSLDAMLKQVAGMENPLLEAGAYTAGHHRVAFRHNGKLVEPDHAAAHINLGTLYYNRQDYGQAEKHYRCAIQIDSRYSLAYFDLGNVLDETGRVTEAIQTYKTALQLAPTYADAHYNLALAYEKIKEPRHALKHWRAYVKLDSSGPWAIHARNQIQRILQADGLKLVHSSRRD